MPQPMVRLEKADGAMLMDSITAAAEGKQPSNKYAKLYTRLEDSLCIYFGKAVLQKANTANKAAPL